MFGSWKSTCRRPLRGQFICVSKIVFGFLWACPNGTNNCKLHQGKPMKAALRPACPDGSNDSIARRQEPHEMTPIYLPENCHSAFQLNWSVAVFGQHDLPPKTAWYESLKTATEADGVRILEVHVPQPRVAQFFSRYDRACLNLKRLAAHSHRTSQQSHPYPARLCGHGIARKCGTFIP